MISAEGGCPDRCKGHAVGDGVTSGGVVHCMTDPYRSAAPTGGGTSEVRAEMVAALQSIPDTAFPMEPGEYADRILAVPLIAEALAAMAKVRRVEDEIAEEETYRKECPAWEITVLVPVKAGDEVAERIFEAVADAAYEAEPEDRKDWDVFVSVIKNPASVPAHLLRRALAGEATS